jgi:hypothetical protein
MPFGNIHPQNPRLFGYLTLIIALALLVLPYNFFPQFYIAKANASMGYVGPATIEGWAFMVMGITLVLVSVFLLKFAPRNSRSTSAK